MKENNRNIKMNQFLIPIIFVMGLVPLIVHLYWFDTGYSEFDWFPNFAETQADFYLAWKMIAIIAVGVIMTCVLFIQYLKNKKSLRFDPAFYSLIIYGVLVCISTVFSPFRYWAVRGTYEFFESVFAVLSYLVICYYTFNFVRQEKQAYVLLLCSGICAIAMILVGFFQSRGLDIFKTDLGKFMMLGSDWVESSQGLVYEFGGNTVYGTLGNPNYVGVYCGLVIPVIFFSIFACKKIWGKLAISILLMGTLGLLKWSESDSGWLALLGSFLITFLIIASRKRITAMIGGTFLILGIIVFFFLMQTNERVEAIKNNFVGNWNLDEISGLRSIETLDEEVILDIGGNKLHVFDSELDNGSVALVCLDDNGKRVEKTAIDSEELEYTIVDERFPGVLVKPLSGDGRLYIQVSVNGTKWVFRRNEQRGYEYYNYLDKWTKVNHKSSGLLNDNMMSSRGRVWNNTIPILSKYILFGSGANTYALAYPQDDYVYRTTFGLNEMFDAKAHSWYLQQWVENGFLASLFLFGFIGWYCVRSAVLYRKADLKLGISWIGIGLWTGVMAYLIAGLANDTLGTAPVFWCLLGLGMAVNRMLCEENA